MEGDPRTSDKLIDDAPETSDPRRMWLAPLLPNQLNRVYLVFDTPRRFSALHLYNYRKTPGKRFLSRQPLVSFLTQTKVLLAFPVRPHILIHIKKSSKHLPSIDPLTKNLSKEPPLLSPSPIAFSPSSEPETHCRAGSTGPARPAGRHHRLRRPAPRLLRRARRPPTHPLHHRPGAPVGLEIDQAYDFIITEANGEDLSDL